ncbi:MAG: winged helix-turn-helix transcriptional regulator [Hamadaea sp.]|uniref:ArsR/SmtB family transcription factor n=1 Tax=Hamadaea sp. TaxID=2024425 RepID=UPI0017AB72C7|nr:winged helix-turn-helix domain-containing protein [Hamadaea sp.]NUR70085.1 winged helix-turn-helix transcriptional regulator [Hamadaea sp.]NUT23423.1 winged helix-turn-helix transcriptional regulator [Hamadaea sp.]
MLRIHFTATDLANTRLAPQPDPLWEAALSMHYLRSRDTPLMLAPWRAAVVHAIRRNPAFQDDLQPLFMMNPPLGYFPDFLTPAQSREGFEAGLEAVLSTPSAQLRREVSLVTVPSRRRSAVDGLYHGELTALHRLERGFRLYRAVALDFHWAEIAAAFDADRSVRVRQLVDEGIGAMLSGLHPTAYFRDGVLHIGSWGMDSDRDIHLGGRGLTVIPCYFKRASQLMVLADSNLPPVLVYPLDHTSRLRAAAQHAPLAALLGATRAGVLASAASLTTTEIALRLRISVPAASRHLAILRDAGLVASVRHRNSVIHTQTPAGLVLLEGPG